MKKTNKNKGFTLVELLAVVVILALLATVTIVLVNGIIDDSRSSVSDIQKEKIEKAAQEYYLKEGNLDSVSSCINLSYLIDNGYFEKEEIKNPESDETMNGSVKITYDSNQYKYEYQEIKCNYICESSKTLTNEATGYLSSETNPYELGVEYKCDLGDGIKRVFYVLEDGANTNLSEWDSIYPSIETNIGTIGNQDDKIALIMGQNINSTLVSWSSNGNTTNGPITALALLPSTSTWKKIKSNQITLPTYGQLKEAGCENNDNTCPNWLYGNYWTNTQDSSLTTAFAINESGSFYSNSITSQSSGVRPVITLSKFDLNS